MTGNLASCIDTEHRQRSLRLALVRGEVLRLPPSAARLRVLSGTAWISLEGEDILLRDCESLPLHGRRGHEAVVSSMGEGELFFELDRDAERRLPL